MKFRKKPLEIEAMQFTHESKDMCFNFVTCNRYADFDSSGDPVLRIQTPEGDMTTTIGDWIIKMGGGKFYPYKQEMLEAIYEPIPLTEMDGKIPVLPPHWRYITIAVVIITVFLQGAYLIGFYST